MDVMGNIWFGILEIWCVCCNRNILLEDGYKNSINDF